MLKGLKVSFKEVLYLTVQKVIHCMCDVIIWPKEDTGKDFFSILELDENIYMERNQLYVITQKTL